MTAPAPEPVPGTGHLPVLSTRLGGGAIEVAAVHLDHSPQAQKLRPSRSVVVERADLRLRNFEMTVCSARVSQVLVECGQIHVQLNAVKRAFGGVLG